MKLLKLLNLLKLFTLFTLILYFLPAQVNAQLDCKKCHKQMATKKFVHTALQMGCESCHTEPHQKNSKFPKGLSAAAPDLCYGCHDKAKFTKKNIHPPVAGGMCSGCHDPHTSDTPKLLLASGSELCFMCHDKKSFQGKSAPRACCRRHVPVMPCSAQL